MFYSKQYKTKSFCVKMGQTSSSEQTQVGSSSTKVIDYFNLKKFLKNPNWCEVARYEEFNVDKCEKNLNTFVMNPENGHIIVSDYCYKKDKKKLVGESIIRKKNQSSRSGDLETSIDGKEWGEYNVLWSDYKNITFIAGKNYSSFWILTRYSEITDERCNMICDSLNQIEALCGVDNIKKWKLVWNNGDKLFVEA